MRPTFLQGQALMRMASDRRFVWNWALARRKAYYAETGKSMPAALLSAELTELKHKPGMEWLRETDSQALQQTLKDLDRAFVNFFEKRGKFPRFKAKKKDSPRFRIPQRVKVADGKVYVPKVGWVRIRQSQLIEGETKSATFKRNASGQWFVTLVVVFTMPDTPLLMPDPASVVGIDLGLHNFVMLSTGESKVAPQFFRKQERKLARAQRRFSRCKKGSNRQRKASQRVARIHQQTADQRQDFLHKLSATIVKRFDGVCVESLNLRGLARTKLAKSFLDAACGEFVRQLAYKTVWQRKHHVTIDRFFPSTRLCHVCGVKNDALTLADREWICCCGVVHDRDLNAARNIRDEGLRLLAAGHADKANARGACVRPAYALATGVEPRIPCL